MIPRPSLRARGAPRGVLVLGMHRSGTSAVTRMVTLLGLAACREDDMVRGPWNPEGHYESRTLMHLDDRLLAEMGSRWWYPPPTGAGYDAAAARIATAPSSARRVFRRAYPSAPWVFKDPRACLLVPFWRLALGPRVAAVVVMRNPLEVARSLERRHGTALQFGVALWERYNRLLLAHVAGMPVLVTRYDDLLSDSRAWSLGTAEFLGGLGMRVSAPAADRVVSAVDPALRHNVGTGQELADRFPGAASVLEAAASVAGASSSFATPPMAPEDPGVQEVLESIGPDRRPAWFSPTEANGRTPPF